MSAISQEQKLATIKAKMQECISKTSEIEAGFTVLNAALSGGMEQTETHLYRLKSHHLITMIELFSERADKLSSVLSDVKYDYDQLSLQLVGEQTASTNISTQEVRS